MWNPQVTKYVCHGYTEMVLKTKGYIGKAYMSKMEINAGPENKQIPLSWLH